MHLQTTGRLLAVVGALTCATASFAEEGAFVELRPHDAVAAADRSRRALELRNERDKFY